MNKQSMSISTILYVYLFLFLSITNITYIESIKFSSLNNINSSTTSSSKLLSISSTTNSNVKKATNDNIINNDNETDNEFKEVPITEGPTGFYSFLQLRENKGYSQNLKNKVYKN